MQTLLTQYSWLTKAVGGGGARWRLGRAINVIFDIANLQGRQQTVSGLQVGGAVTFIGKGSSAIEGRSFKAVGAKLYYYQAGCGGLYKLNCRRSLALVKREGKASEAYAGGAYADRACVDKAYADETCIGGACADEAYADRACVGGAYINKAFIDRAAYQGVGITGS